MDEDKGSAKQKTLSQVKALAVFLHDYQYGKALGGVERRFVEVSKVLRSMQVRMYALEYEPSLSSSLNTGYIPLILERRRQRSYLGELILVIQLSLIVYRVCKRLGCSLIYSPSSVYLQTIPAYVASKFLRVPHIIIFHSYPYGKPSTLFGILRRELRKGHSLKRSLLNTIIEFLRFTAYKQADACLAVSRSTMRQILSSFKPKRAAISGNGVGKEWLSEISNCPKIYDACFVGRVSPRKGIELLIFAWKKVTNEIPGVKLVVVGGGESQKYIQGCLSLVDKLNLSSCVTFTGFLSDLQVRQILASSKIFVMPSSREGFGLSVVEAMALGIPCILSHLPSFEEIFGDCAMLVRSREPEEWGRAITNLLNDEVARNRLSKLGQNVAARYRWENVGRIEADIIMRLVNSSQT